MRSSKFEFFTLLAFLVIAGLVLTNGFAERIFAKDNKVDAFESVEPIADVLTEIMRSYVREPDVNKVVEGALAGMMMSLDKHSSYVPAEQLKELTNDTEGQFDGIGVTIGPDEDKNIIVAQQPIPGSPAAKAGLLAGDIIVKIDQVDAKGMTTTDVAQRIKGPRGSVVHLTLLRKVEGANPRPSLSRWKSSATPSRWRVSSKREYWMAASAIFGSAISRRRQRGIWTRELRIYSNRG